MSVVEGNLLPVELPGGGTALVRRRLSHERHIVRLASYARLGRALEEMGVPDGEEDRDSAIADGRVDGYALARAQTEHMYNVIEACVHSWEGVPNLDTGDPLPFPDGVRELGTEDLQALFAAQERALVSADPNGGRARSSRPSRPTSPRRTRSGR